MPKSKTKNNKRKLPTPEKVCGTPVSKRVTMNTCSPTVTQSHNATNLIGMNNGYMHQMPMNTPMTIPMQNSACSPMSQQMTYSVPVQGISNSVPGTPSQQQLVYNTQQSPIGNGQQQMPPVQAMYQDNMNTMVMSDIQSILHRLESRMEAVDSKMNKLNDIEKQVKSMSLQFSKFENRVTSLETEVTQTNKRVVDLENSRAFDSQTCEEVNSKCKDLDSKLKSELKQCDSLQNDLSEVKSDNIRLSEEMLDLQSRSMRDNLLFHGIKECETFDARRQENCADAIIQFCTDQLKLENASEIRIDRAHRLGKFNAEKTRPIVVKLNFYPDKVKIKQKASAMLRESNQRVSDQFPREIQERRRILYPELKKALDQGKRAYLSYDKLYVDGRTITVDNMRARGANGSS